MGLALYGGQRTRASMPRWYMEEKGIAYDWRMLDMQAGEHKQEPFLSINPFGKLPALVHEDPALPSGRLQMFESGAILLYLAELSGECGSSAERSLAAQWVLFANATLATALFVPTNREKEFPRLMGVLNRLLDGGKPLMGGSWGVADCAVNAYLAYLPMFFPDLDLSPYPAVQATIAATQARPAYRKVMGLA
ncbi:glutathione S-transferase family protein [Synechococcus sp. MIT S9452]|uniref:glutathione S-transferase family protein n=1 Tax=Synechococcus sp. MIT S9452 TaxID=3082546 RepID=UPI0039A75E17